MSRRLIFTGGVQADVTNRYTPGSGVGSRSTAVRRALLSRAANTCCTYNSKTNCHTLPYYHSHPHTHGHHSHGHGSHGHGHHGGHGHHHNQKSTVLALSQQTVSASPSDPIILAADKEGKFPPSGLNFTVTTNETTVNIENLNYVDQKLNLNVEIPYVNNQPIYGLDESMQQVIPGYLTLTYNTNDIFNVNYYLIIKNGKTMTQPT